MRERLFLQRHARLDVVERHGFASGLRFGLGRGFRLVVLFRRAETRKVFVLNAEELAFLRFGKVDTKDQAGVLTRATGKPWNAVKIDRVRKRLEYVPRKLKILEAAKRRLASVSETNWLTAGSDTVRKVRSFHANSSVKEWLHKDLLKRFR